MTWRAADLHIHSALSPCAAPEMTPRRIVAEAARQGLAVIALCDHNSVANVAVVQEAAQAPLLVLAGMEIMTREEAHIVGLFPDVARAEAAARCVSDSLPLLETEASVFGEQCLMDAQDRVIGREERMLGAACALDLDETVRLIHAHGGLAVAAHVDRPSFSVVSQLGFFPEPNEFDAIEITPFGLRAGRQQKFKDSGLPMIVSSDSHYLTDIGRGFTELQMGALDFDALAAALTGPESGDALMRDLSLHLLDLIENSTRAGASVVAISIEQYRARDLMTFSIEDDGPGLTAPPEQATDPFYTTKPNKRVGLGLSLFAAAAERAGGRMEIGQSPLGGLALRATMRLGHVDRAPLGDIASTLATAICSNAGVNFRVSLSVDGTPFAVSSAATAARMPPPNDSAFTVARQVTTEIRNAMTRLKFVE